jgi:uncharacterized protein
MVDTKHISRSNQGRDDGNLLLIFVRAPEAGKVKTRLARRLGGDTALALYCCFVADTLALARNAGYRSVICYHPPEARDHVVEWLHGELSFEPQKGDDIGERMYEALEGASYECDRAVLIGSDTPDLAPAILREAFTRLADHDAVIGPASDGGYYLIGFSSGRLIRAPFQALPWGGERVFQATMRILKQEGLKVHLLPAWTDIDEYADLQTLLELRKDVPRGTLATIDYLRDIVCL